MFKAIRANHLCNVIVRNILLFCSRWPSSIQKRWPISGYINLTFHGIDFKYYCQTDDQIADTFFYKAKYIELADIRVFLLLAGKSNIIFDIGANTGMYSVIGGKTNPEASIYSFEPHPANAERLRINIALNKLSNVLVTEIAVGKSNNDIEFFVPSSGGISDTSSSLRSFSESTYEGKIDWKAIMVGQTTLDNFIEKNVIEHVNLVKIDVEGCEIMVCEGAKRLFTEVKPVIICEIFLTVEKLIYFNRFVEQYGYTAYMILSEGLVRLDDGLIQHVSGLNYLFSVVRLSKIFIPFKEIEGLIQR